jgi:hypothetical protein
MILIVGMREFRSSQGNILEWQFCFIALLHGGQAYDGRVMKKLNESDVGQVSE